MELSENFITKPSGQVAETHGTRYRVTLSLTYVRQRPPDVPEPLPDLPALRQVDQDERPQRPRPAVVLEPALPEHWVAIK